MKQALLAACLLPLALPSSAHPAPAAQVDGRAAAPEIFDPARDLDGFDKAVGGTYASLYDLEPFRRLQGRDLNAAELADARRRWSEERLRVAALIRDIETDPREAFVFALQYRMSRIGVFERAGLERIDGAKRTVYFVEPPLRGMDQLRNEVLEELDPWCVRMEELFDELYAAPLQLRRAPGRGAQAICLFGGRAQFREFGRLLDQKIGTKTYVLHDEGYPLTVTYRGRKGLREELPSRREALMHAQVLDLVDAHNRSDDPVESWLRRGLAGYLSEHDGKTPKALDVRSVDPEWLHYLARLLQPEARELMLPALEELVAFDAPSDFHDWASKRWGQRTGGTLIPGWGEMVHDAQSSLLVHFLHRGAKGKYADGFRQYLGLALEGTGGPAALKRCLGVGSLAEVDAEFVAFATERFNALYPQNPVASLESIFPADKRTASASGTGRAKSTPRKKKPSTSRKPKTTGRKKAAGKALPAAPSTGSLAVGRAASTLSANGLAAAQTELETWLAEARDDAPGRALVEREVARIGRFLELRAAAIDALVTRGKKLSVKLPEGKLVASIEGVADGVLRLGKNRLGLDELPVDGIPAREWALLMMDRKRTALDLEEAMVYPLALEGEDALGDAPKRLKVSDEWVQSARIDYPEARSDALLARSLEGLAALPEDGAVSEEALALVNRLLVSSDAGSEAMDAHMASIRKALLKRGVDLLERRFDGLPLEDLVAGKVERVREDVYRITWDFEDEAQMADFMVGDPDIIDQDGTWLLTLPMDDPLTIRDGTLAGSGNTMLQTVLRMEAVEARWTTAVGTLADEQPTINFCVGVNVSESGGYVAAQGLDFLTVSVRRDFLVTGEGSEVKPGSSYDSRLHLDGNGWHLAVDGRGGSTNAHDAPERGHVVIGSLSLYPVAFDDLVLTGRVDERRLQGLREAKAAAEAERRGWTRED